MEIPLVGLAARIQSKIDEWNVGWRKLEAEAEKVATMRQTILDEIETGAPGDLIAKAGALEGRVFGIHQKKAAALRDRAEILSTCYPAQVSAVADLESAVSKAEKTAEAGLKKAGISAESDPHFAEFPEAARHRLMVRVRECSGVRDALAELQDAKGLLDRVTEARHQNKLILQSGIDELNAVARKLLRM